MNRNHPNRGRRRDNPARNPTPQEVREARERAGMTQEAAAGIIYCSYRTWQDWEAGARRMHPAFWRLWRMLVSAGVRE